MRQVRNQVLLKAIGLAFKELRNENNLTQEDVYNDTGIHIGRIETAQTNLTVSTLQSLCNYYEVNLVDFIKRVKS